MATHEAPESVEKLIKKVSEAQASFKSFEADARMVLEHRITGASTSTGRHVYVESEIDGKAVLKMFTCWTMNIRGVRGEVLVHEIKTVRDGTYEWREQRHSDRAEVLVIKTDAIDIDRAEAGKSFWNEMADSWEQQSVKLLGEDVYDGRKMFVFEAAAKGPSGLTFRTWIGQDDYFVYRWVHRVASSGDDMGIVTTTEWLNVKVNQPVDPKLFEYTPPAGAKIEDKTKAKP